MLAGMRVSDSAGVNLTQTALRNVAVRRVVGAFAAVTVGEWVLGTTVAIHAYSVGGALLVGLVGFRFLPAAFAGLLTASLADTHRREWVLTATAGTRAIASGLAAGALALKLPFVVPLLLVWLDAAAGSAYRPAQAALIPTIVATPAEFTAASALASNAKSSGQIVGALAGGLLVAGLPIGIAVSVAAGLQLVAAITTAGIKATVAPRLEITLRERLARMREGARTISGDREAKEIVGYACLRSLIRGLWLSLGVVASLRLLGLGKAGFGILMAAAGVGALIAIPISAVLIGRRWMARWLAGALLMCGVPIAAIGGDFATGAAIAFMVGWGMGMALSDVAGQTVLVRVVPAAAIGRVTGLTESGKLLFEGGASLLAPLLVATLGIRDALIVAGFAVSAVVAAGARSFARIDARASDRVELVQLLAQVPLFHGLRVDALEAVVSALQRISLPPGRDVVTEGVRDDRGWYLVEQGRLEVLINGFVVNEVTRGGGFGELALLRDRPRAATVRTTTDVTLLALERDAFLSAVSGTDVTLSGSLEAAPASGDDHAALIGRTPLLQGVGRRALEQLARGALVHEVPAGAAIVTEHEIDDRYHVLLAGRATVSVGGETRAELMPGDGFGEIAVLHRVPRSATVLAREPCRLLTVGGEDVRAAVQARGGVVGELASGHAADAPAG